MQNYNVINFQFYASALWVTISKEINIVFQETETSLLGLSLPLLHLFPWSIRKTPSRYGQP